MEEKNLPAALDDLRVIRQVLDRTAASFRTLAPVFRRMGLVWLCQAVLYTLAVTTDLLIYLFPALYDHLSWTRALIPAAQWSMLPLGIYLVAECLLWQRKKATYAPLNGQLVTLWQFFLLLYLVLFALFQAGMYWQTHDLPMVLPELSEEVVSPWTGFLICQGFLAFLPVLFPGVPLLITGAMLGEKVAIVSSKPQTTRNRITGILTEGEDQFVFLDTPGIFRPQNSDRKSTRLNSSHT